MSALIDTFEKEYASVTSDISVKIGRVPNLNGAEKKNLIGQVERQFEEAQELLEQMDLEVKSLPQTTRPKYQTRLLSYQSELTKLKKDLRHAVVAFSDEAQAREELLGDEESYGLAEEQRALLLDNTERMDRSTHKLSAGYKVAIETENVGADILNSLHSQRQTITRTRERLRNTDDDLSKSSRILTGMIRRLMQNRLVLYGVFVLLVIVIILAIYFSFKKHS